MAKSGNGRSGRGSKLRFIMLEADLADGDLSQITQAITNALKPAASSPRLIPAQSPARPALAADVTDEVDAEVEDESDDESPATDSTRSKPKTPRVYRMPERLDLDIAAFREFAKAKNPPDEAMMRHLTAAVWFKEHFSTPNVTVDHAYSAYLEAGWSTKMTDFDRPFRKLKAKGLVKRIEPGTYTVTFPGLNTVAELGKPAGTPANDGT